MNELDAFIEDELIPRYTKGKERSENPAYQQYRVDIWRERRNGNREEAERLAQERRKIPSRDPRDPDFRRLRYIRYADDFILSFAGPKEEAESIKREIQMFLREQLKLEMNNEKTLITHARSEHARFLNYDISIYHNDEMLARKKNEPSVRTRSVNGKVRLGVPYGLTQEKAQPYTRKGKVIADAALLTFSDAHIIDIYQSRYRGLAEYYKYAVDRHELGSLKNVMQSALVKTLMQKYKLSISQVYRKYRGKVLVNGYEYSTLQVEVPTKRGTRLVYWGAVPLKVANIGTGRIDDTKFVSFEYRSDLIQRLQADKCELCGSEDNCEVHHVRKLSDLKQRWAGRKEKPLWVARMIAMERKTLIVCHECHRKIHAGEPTPSSE